MRIARRLQKLPSYFFASIDEMLAKAAEDGVDIISFGIGDPDRPTPPYLVKEMARAIEKPSNHRYPNYKGSPAFRNAVGSWYKRRYGIKLDTEGEIIALIGSKEGIAHLAFCFIEAGTEGIYPDPCYPVYPTAIVMAGGNPVPLPLNPEDNYQPDMEKLQKLINPKVRLLYLNYPHNPTGVLPDPERLQNVVNLAKKYGFIIAYDNAYSEIIFEGDEPFSIIALPGAKDVAIEFQTCSKTFNMTGWRIGWAVGNPKIISALACFKTNVDSGVFTAIQETAIKALADPMDSINSIRETYHERRDLLVNGLHNLGWPAVKNESTFFLWIPVPNGEKAETFATRLFQATGVFITPGTAYGEQGEGFLRFSLTLPQDRISEALARLNNKGFSYA